MGGAWSGKHQWGGSLGGRERGAGSAHVWALAVLGPVFLSDTPLRSLLSDGRGRGGHLASFPTAQRLARRPVLMAAGGRRAKAPQCPAGPWGTAVWRLHPNLRLVLWR